MSFRKRSLSTTADQTDTPDAEAPPLSGGPFAGLTRRALVIAVVCTLLAGVWVRQSEIVVLSTQVSESVPAIPGLAALVALVALNGLAGLLRIGKPLTRAEIVVIFLFVTVSSTIMGIGVTQFLISLLTAPFYYKDEGITSAGALFPKWLAPHDTEAIRRLYEHAPNGRVPWELWWQPGLAWLGFFLAFWWTMYCMMGLFYRVWAEEERLAFPLVALPMEMTGPESARVPFFRNKLMWGGFGLSAAYNLVNIAHAFYPQMISFGKEIDFSPLFTVAPWSEVAPLHFYIRPELVGLGYLVSTEISLTAWLSYALMKLAAVFGAGMGYPPGKLPFEQEQGIGAYLTLAVVLTVLARRHLQHAWRLAVAGSREVGPEGMTYRRMYLGLAAGFAAVTLFAWAAGMALWVAAAYMAVVLAVALVYGRLRAEAGVPLIWLFPFAMQKEVFTYTFGTPPFVASSPSTMPVWGAFTFLARGYYPELSGYQIEAMELSRRARIDGRKVAGALFLAVALGVILGWYHHLVPYYRYGALQLRGGIWGTWVSIPEYRAAVSAATTIHPPDLPRVWATGVGACVALALTVLRLRFAGFPLHPIGYAMTCSYGSLVWGPFLVVWILKTMALRWGGRGFYRTTVPFFLGLALGHFAIAGILWGLTGAWAGDAVQGYPVWFG